MRIGIGIDVGAGLPWLPSTRITGCKLWLRADLGVTIVSSKVSSWADQSGNGDANRNAAQSNGALRPTQAASDASYNNQATLAFASGVYLATGAWSAALAQPCTWIIVGHDPGTSDDVAIDGIANGHRQFTDRNDGTHVTMYAGGTQTPVAADWKTPKASLLEFNDTSSKIFFNDFTTATATGLSPGTNDLTGLTVGATFSGAATWNGTIAEIIAYNKLLDANEKAGLRAYLNARYGLSIA